DAHSWRIEREIEARLGHGGPMQRAGLGRDGGPRIAECVKDVILALLWQIYSRCCSLQIHFRQCGHRRGGSRAISSRMAWRTAGRVGWGGGPLILFFPPCCCEAAMLEEGVRAHRHERMTV